MRTFLTGKVSKELMPIVNTMTNWQRNQWARKGYPTDEKQVRRFSRLQRYVGQIVTEGRV
jgi:hypothetical protein